VSRTPFTHPPGLTTPLQTHRPFVQTSRIRHGDILSTWSHRCGRAPARTPNGPPPKVWIRFTFVHAGAVGRGRERAEDPQQNVFDCELSFSISHLKPVSPFSCPFHRDSPLHPVPDPTALVRGSLAWSCCSLCRGGWGSSPCWDCLRFAPEPFHHPLHQFCISHALHS